jgi:hypothetical protein
LTEEQPSNLEDGVLSLEENLNRLIDFVSQSQRNQQVQLRSQQDSSIAHVDLEEVDEG